MACKQACNIGYAAPAADYLLRPIANDNRPPRFAREWVVHSFSILACIAAQYSWSEFLMWQLQN